jgi:uncharacterized protein YggU (UPF0235/DUF167 family)
MEVSPMPRTIHIKLTPKASSDRVGDVRENEDGQAVMQVYVTAVPEDGKANEAMIRLLAKHYKVAPSRVTILRGAHESPENDRD